MAAEVPGPPATADSASGWTAGGGSGYNALPQRPARSRRGRPAAAAGVSLAPGASGCDDDLVPGQAAAPPSTRDAEAAGGRGGAAACCPPRHEAEEAPVSERGVCCHANNCIVEGAQSCGNLVHLLYPAGGAAGCQLPCWIACHALQVAALADIGNSAAGSKHLEGMGPGPPTTVTWPGLHEGGLQMSGGGSGDVQAGAQLVMPEYRSARVGDFKFECKLLWISGSHLGSHAPAYIQCVLCPPACMFSAPAGQGQGGGDPAATKCATGGTAPGPPGQRARSSEAHTGTLLKACLSLARS